MLPIYKFAIREDLKDCEDLFLPKQAESLSTGWDVKAAFPNRKSIMIYAFDKVLIPLGFRAFCPKGYWYELKPRSSTFAKKHLNCLYGTIDESYENELLFACSYIPPNNDNKYLTINFGDALGQIIPVKRQEMIIEKISNDEFDKLCLERNAQRKGGFGSTTPEK